MEVAGAPIDVVEALVEVVRLLEIQLRLLKLLEFQLKLLRLPGLWLILLQDYSSYRICQSVSYYST